MNQNIHGAHSCLNNTVVNKYIKKNMDQSVIFQKKLSHCFTFLSVIAFSHHECTCPHLCVLLCQRKKNPGNQLVYLQKVLWHSVPNFKYWQTNFSVNFEKEEVQLYLFSFFETRKRRNFLLLEDTFPFVSRGSKQCNFRSQKIIAAYSGGEKLVF